MLTEDKALFDVERVSQLLCHHVPEDTYQGLIDRVL
jgi:hypothetical protein